MTRATDGHGGARRMRILVVEDDARTARHIADCLQREGHDATEAQDARRALELARSGRFDLLIVDRLLPGLDGLSMVSRLRRAGNPVPVLFLSALDGLEDRVEGLRAGGDDYLVKPFAASELAARVAALGRRADLSATRLCVADLEIDLVARRARRGERPIALQPREFRLLEVLMRNAGQVVTRDMLLHEVWNFHFDPRTTVVETHVSRLRAKIEPPPEPPLLHTERGAGYRLRAPG